MARNLLLLQLLLSLCAYSRDLRDTVKINALLKQATILQRSHEDSCYHLAAEAYRLSLQLDYKKGMYGAFVRIGSVLTTRGFHDSACAFFKEALFISRNMHDVRRISGAYVLLSSVYQGKGWQDSAFAALYEAMRYSSQVSDTPNLILVHNTLADLKFDYQDYISATRYYLTMAELSGLYGDHANTATAYIGLGNSAYRLQKIKTALVYYLKADTLARKAGDEITAAQNLNNIGLCYEGLHDSRQAINYYQLALNAYILRGMSSEEANVYYNLAHLYITMNQPERAVQLLNRAVLLNRANGESGKTAACYELLADAWALRGDFMKAYHYHREFTTISDSLLNAEKISSISEMQVRYETEKKEQQIQLLDEQHKTRSAQRNFFIAGSLVLLLGLIALAIYYFQRRKLARKNELIARQQIDELLNTQEIKTYNAMIAGQEEERQRIAGDLHDRLGSMLATVKLLFSGLETKVDEARDENKRQYEKANKLLDEACVEVRRISHNMSTGMVMIYGLIPALEELCESIESSGLIKCKLMFYGIRERPEQQTEIGIYRIIQELLGNILKHAKAKQVTVQLNQTEESLSITVEDDGVGFLVNNNQKKRGLGMQNIQARVVQLNGVYHVDSTPGKGTVSIVEIPLTSGKI